MSIDNKNAAPVGVFDSGVGGLTVAREIMRQLPNENLVYFGDTARVPYYPLFQTDYPFPEDKRGESDCDRMQYG